MFSVLAQPRTSGLQLQSIGTVTEVRVADRDFPITEATLSEAPGLRRMLQSAPRDAQNRPVLDVDPGLFSSLLTFIRTKRWPADSHRLSNNELKILRHYAQRFGLPLLEANVEKTMRSADKSAHFAYGLALGQAASISHDTVERDELNRRAHKRLCRAQDMPAELTSGPTAAGVPANFSFAETRSAPLTNTASLPLFAVQTPRPTPVAPRVLRIPTHHAQAAVPANFALRCDTAPTHHAQAAVPANFALRCNTAPTHPPQAVVPANFALRCDTAPAHHVLLSGQALLDATKAESESKKSAEGALPHLEQALRSLESVPLDARSVASYALTQEAIARVATNYIEASQNQTSDAEDALRLDNTLLARAKLQSARRLLSAVPPAWTHETLRGRANDQLLRAESTLLLKTAAPPPNFTAPTRPLLAEQVPSTEGPVPLQVAVPLSDAQAVDLPTTPEWDNLVAMIPDVVSEAVPRGS